MATSIPTPAASEGRQEEPQNSVNINWDATCLGTSPVTSMAVQNLAKEIGWCALKVHGFDPAAAENLHAARKRLTDGKVVVTFCGRFKSGKSLLVNRMIGRDLLPVNVEAETGAPCFLEAGSADIARSLHRDQTREIPCTTGALREEFSLWKRRIGTISQEPAGAVHSSLANVPIPHGVRWVDTPGLDESLEMDIATTQVLRGSDVVLWVFNSETALAQKEAEYVRQHVEETGPSAILFLTNVMIRDSRTHEESWAQFRNHQMPSIRNRIHEFAGRMGFDGQGPRMLSVCGSAIGRTADDRYGSYDVRRFLQSVTSSEHCMVTAGRLFHAAVVLRRVAESLESRVQEIRGKNQELRTQKADYENRQRIKRARFCRSLDTALDAFVGGFRTDAVACGRSLANSVSASELRRDSSYQESLDKQLKDHYGRYTSVLRDEAVKAAQENDQSCDFRNVLDTICEHAPLDRPSVSVPLTTFNHGGAGKAGAAIGTLLALNFYNPVAWVGAGVATAVAIANAKAKQAKALAADAGEASALIRSEAQRIADRIASCQQQLREALLQSVYDGGTHLPVPNQEMEDKMGALLEEVQKLRDKVLGTFNTASRL